MKSLIIVEDDVSILESLNMVFNGVYQVSLFLNAEPLMKSQFTHPDLFLIDHRLSGITGMSLCQFLKNNQATCSIPVILMSASPNMHRLALSAGADDFLEKPYSIKALREMISKYI